MQCQRVPPALFAKLSPAPIAFDRSLGLCFGWFCFSKQNGEPYVDAHGDHFPDDELVKAVDELMAKPAADREINVEHAGGARGSIATAQALTEDVAKSLGIDTGGTYGVVGSFRPDAALMKSIAAGEMFCLSIEGKAHDVETVAKSGDGDIAASAHKRTMRKVELTKLAVVKAGAHAGASVTLIKSARAVLVAKATPALTSADAGHQHAIHDIDEASGCTSSEQMAGQPNDGWHSHLFVRNPDGSLSIAMALGHTHTLASTTEITAMADADLAKTNADLTKRAATLSSLLLIAATMPADQAAFAKSLPAEKLEGFLSLPEAERVAKATPVYKAADGTCYFASDDPRMVALAKSDDAKTLEIAKAKANAEVATFEKAAARDAGNLPGKVGDHAWLLKAIDEAEGAPEQKAAAVSLIRAANGAYGEVFKSKGFGSNGAEPGNALAEFDKGLAEFAKSVGKAESLVADDFLETPKGAELYRAYEAETAATRRGARA